MPVLFRACVLGLALVAATVSLPASWVEYGYSRSLYLAIQHGMTACSNRVGFAWLDLLIGLGGALALARAARGVRRSWRSRGAWAAVGIAILNLTAGAATVYLVFLGTWGLNYRREPLTSRLEYRPDTVTPGAVVALWRESASRVNALHERAHREGWPDWNGVAGQLAPAYAEVQRDLADVSPAVPGRPKASVLDWFFRRAGVDGMTDPFFLEVLVNHDLLPFERPAVLAHEWGHLAGYASESEANFIGWIICLRGEPPIEYSGRLALLWQLAGALPAPDRQALVRLLADGPREDLRAVTRRIAGTTPMVREVSWRVYDRYLKANRVEQGTEDYSVGLRLMVGTAFDEGWRPRRRAGAHN